MSFVDIVRASMPPLDDARSFRFRERPVPLPAPLRVFWRMVLLCLLLQEASRSGTTSLRRLHVLNWALRSPSARRGLLAVVDGRRRPEDVIVRYDPTLSIVLDFAIAERLVERLTGSRLRLTARGARLIKQVVEDGTTLVEERAFFSAIGKSITEAMVVGMARIAREA